MTARITNSDPPAAGTRFKLRPLARSIHLALIPGLAASVLINPASAAPTGGVVQAGAGSISHSSTVTTINQQSARLAIDWATFNVGASESVNFHQPGRTAEALNRIFDQNPSEIFGQINANGRVLLMNPNGVFFKPGAQVNVGSLIAGAMQIGLDDFMAGNYRLEALQNAQGRVINEGMIQAAEGGDVTLVGKSIANTGVIVATAGRVNLVAGDKVTLDFDGDGLLKFTVDEEVVENATALDDQISNTGELLAEGGDVLITASAAEDVFANTINNSGLIKAGRIDRSGGMVRLVGMGPSASVLNSGQIDVSAGTATDDGGVVEITAANITNGGLIIADATAGGGGSIHVESTDTTITTGTVSATSTGGGAGGEIRLLGDNVGLFEDALVDASGTTGGGEVLIGGDFQGNNPEVKNATLTFVGGDAAIKADAVESGDGGKVIVWADETTWYFGEISATGGSDAGDGGDVEVSGKQNLTFAGGVDVNAQNGDGGSLLLDPDDLFLSDTDPGGGAIEDTEATANVFEDALAGGQDHWVDVNDTIEGITGNVDVEFRAGNDIEFQDDIDMTGLGPNATVRFEAGNEIRMAGFDLDTGSGAAGADIFMTATGGSILLVGTLTGEDILLSSATGITQMDPITATDLIVQITGNGSAVLDNGANNVVFIAADIAGTGDFTYFDTDNVQIEDLTVDGVNVVGVTTADGSVTIEGDSMGVIEAITTATLGAANDVTLTASTGGIALAAGAITAPGATVTVTAAGDISDSSDNTLSNIDAATAILSAGGDAGIPGDALELSNVTNLDVAAVDDLLVRTTATLTDLAVTVTPNSDTYVITDNDPGTTNLTFDVSDGGSEIDVNEISLLAGDLNFALTVEGGTMNVKDVVDVGAGDIDLTTNTSGDILLESGSDVSGTDVALIAADVITQDAGGMLTAVGLGLQGTSITLDSGDPDVDVLAANLTASGNFSYADATGVEVGTVGAIIGVTTTDGTIDISTADGDLTISDDVVTGMDNDITLTAVDGGGGSGDIAVNALVDAGMGLVTLAADDAVTDTGGSISADDLEVTAGATVLLDEATHVVTNFEGTVTAAGDLTFVNATALIIGGVNGATTGVSTTDGFIDVSTVDGNLDVIEDVVAGSDNDVLLEALDGGGGMADLTLTGVTIDAGMGDVGLLADGAIVDGTGNTITADGLAVRATAFPGTLAPTVSRLAADITGGGDFVLVNVGDLEIFDFVSFGISGVTTAVGMVDITTTGSLTISGTVTAAAGGADVTLTTLDSGGTDTLAVDAAVTGMVVTLDSADDVTQAGGSVVATDLEVTAADTVTLDSATNAVTNLEGTVTAVGDFTFVNASGLNVGGVNAGTTGVSTTDGFVDLSTVDGSLTVSEDVVAGTSNDIDLTAADAGGGAADIGVDALLDATGAAVTLTADGGVTDTGGSITADDLEVTAGGTVLLDAVATDVTNLEGTVTAAGDFTFVNATGLNVGGIGATTGVSTTDGFVDLSTLDGSLTVSEDIVAGTANDIDLTAVDAGGGAADIGVDALLDATGAAVTLTADGGVTDTGGSITADDLEVTAGGTVLLDAVATDVTNLEGTVTAAGDFTFVNATGLNVGGIGATTGVSTTDGFVDLSTVDGSLTVSEDVVAGTSNDIDLTAVDAGGGAADIGVDALLDATGAAVTLTADGGVTDTGGSITADDLEVIAGATVLLDEATHAVANIEGTMTAAGDFTFVNSTALIVGGVNGATGISTTDGFIDVSTVDGNLDVIEDVVTGTDNDVLLQALDGGGGMADITLTAVTVDAGLGNVGLLADGDIVDGGGNTITADGLAVRATAFPGTLAPVVSRLAADITGGGDFVLVNVGDLEIFDFVSFGIAGVTTAAGFVDITTTGSLTISGAVTAAAGAMDVTLTTLVSGGTDTLAIDAAVMGTVVTLDSADDVTQTGGSVLATDLEVTAADTVLLDSATNAVTNFEGTVTAAGDLTFVNATGLTIGGVNAGTTGVSTTDGFIDISTLDGNLDVNEDVVAGTDNDVLLEAIDGGGGMADITLTAVTVDAGIGNVGLLADGDIVDGGGSAIVADGLAVRATAFPGTLAPVVSRLAADITGGGDFVLVNVGDLDIFDFVSFGISGVTTAVGMVDITTTGALTISGTVMAAAGAADVTLTTLVSGGTDTLAIDAAVTGAVVTLDSADDVTQTGGSVVATDLEVTAAGAVDLDGLNTVTDLEATVTAAGDFTFVNTTGVNIGGVNAGTTGVSTTDGFIDISTLDGSLTVSEAIVAGTSNDIDLTAVDAGGGAADIGVDALLDATGAAVTLTADGGVTDTGGSITADDLEVTAGGTVLLDAVATDVTNLEGTVTAAGDFTFVNATGLNVGGIGATTGVSTTDGFVDLSTVDGSLTVSEDVVAGTSNDIDLTAVDAGGGAADIDVDALLDATGAAVTLTADGGVTDTGGSITADDLEVTAGGTVLLDAVATTVTNLEATVTAAGDFTFVNATGLNVGGIGAATGVSTTDGFVDLSTVDGSLTVSEDIVAGTANDIDLTAVDAGGGAADIGVDALLDATGAVVTLTADGGVTDTGGSITADDLEVTAGGTVLLDAVATDVTNLEGTVTAAGDFTFVNATGLNVGGIGATTGVSTTDGFVDLSTVDGSLTVSEAIVAGTSNDIDLTAVDGGGGAADIGVDALLDATGAAVTLTADGGVTDTGGSITADDLEVTAGGAVVLDAVATAVGNLEATVIGAASGFTFINAVDLIIGGVSGGTTGVSTVDGVVDVTTTGTLTVSEDVTAGGGNDVLLTTLDSGGTDTLAVDAAVTGTVVTLDSDDDVTQAGGSVLATDLEVTAAGDVALGGANAVTNLEATVTGGPGNGFTYVDTGSLTIGGVNAGTTGVSTANGVIDITATGTLTVAEAVVAGGANDLSLTTANTGGMDTLTISADIDADGDNVFLTSADGIAHTMGTITATGLAIDAGLAPALMSGDVDIIAAVVTGANEVFTYTDINSVSIGTVGLISGITTSNGDITVDTLDGFLDVDDAVDAGTAMVTLTTLEMDGDAGTDARIELNADIDGGTVLLTSADTITQLAGAITASDASLGVVAEGAITLNGPNAVNKLSGQITGAGDFSYNDIGDLEIAAVGAVMPGVHTVSGMITITAGMLTVTDDVDAGAGANNVTLTTLATGGADTIAVNAMIRGDTVTLDSADDITETGGTVIATALDVTAVNDVTLGAAGNDVGTLAASVTGAGFTFVDMDGFTVGTVTNTGITAAGDISLTTMGGNMAVNQVVSALGNRVTLDATGTISESATGQVLATELQVVATGAVTLDDIDNDVDTLAADLSAAGAGSTFTYADNNGLTIGTVATAGVATMNGAIAISFGQDGVAATIDIDDTISAGTSSLVVNGGGGDDTINLNTMVTGAAGRTLNGAGGNDGFIFANGTAVDVVNGGTSPGADAGSDDILDLSAYLAGSGAITFTLTATDTGATSGALTTSFNGIENLTSGQNGADRLVDGTGGTSTFTLTGTDTGTTTLLTGTWVDIENLDGMGGGDTLIGSTRYDLTGGTDMGTAAGLSGMWTGIANLQGSGGATDVLAGANVVSIDGSDSGFTPVTATNRISGTWTMIANVEGTAAGTDTFNILNGGTLSGDIDGLGMADTLSYAAFTTGAVTVTLDTSGTNAGSATDIGGFDSVEIFEGSTNAADILVGRNAPTVWTLDGGLTESLSDGEATDTTFSGFEILQGGTAVDEFNVSFSVTFTELRGGDGAVGTVDGDDVFRITDDAVLTADIFGEAGGDTVIFGIPEPAPDASTGDEFANVDGLINLGSDTDRIDFSGSDLIVLTTLTGPGGIDGDDGTILDFPAVSNPPDADLIADGFFNVDQINGNGTVLQGDDVATVWIITGLNKGFFGGPTIADSTTAFTNFSVQGGTEQDVFIFDEQGTGETPALLFGLDGGLGVENFLLGSEGVDTFTITGATSVDVEVDGTSGLVTTIGANINHIGEGGAFIDGDFTDTGDDMVGFGVGSTWGGDIFTNGGSDTIVLPDGAVIGGLIDGGSLGTNVDSLDMSAFTENIAVTVTAFGSIDGSISYASDSFDFFDFEDIKLGDLSNDTLTFDAAPGGGAIAVHGGLGGNDTLATTATFGASDWVVRDSTDNAGTLNTFITFDDFENASSAAAATFAFPTSAATQAGFTGSINADITLSQASAFFGAAGLNVIAGGDVTLTGAGPYTLDADNAAINIAGDLVAGGTALTLDAGTAAVNIGGDITSGAFSAAATGGFAAASIDTGGGAADTTIAAGAGAVDIAGNIATDALTITGNAGIDIGSVDATSTFTANAGGGGLTVSGTTNAFILRVSSTGANDVRDVNTTGDIDFNGAVSSTTLRGDLTVAGAGEIDFQGAVVIAGNVTMSTAVSNIIDFNGEVSGASTGVLNILPTAGTDMFIDDVDGAGHLAHDKFENLQATLVIGGQLDSPDVIEGTVLQVTADYITIVESLVTGGSLALLGSTVEIAPKTAGSNIVIQAGAEGGAGEIAVIAYGEETGNPDMDGLDGGVDIGSIAAPSTGTVEFISGRAMLAATGEIMNSTNMIMSMGGGDVLVAQTDAAANPQVDFNVQSNAVESQTLVTDTLLVNSLVDVLNVTRAINGLVPLFGADALFSDAQVFFPNPAAILTILQAAVFVDASLFDEDLSIFGQLGDAIAKPLDQCEEVEGCAPFATLEELDEYVERLESRIQLVQALVDSGKVESEDADRLIALYQDQLDRFESYEAQLVAYIAEQEEGEFGEFDEFEDVFEAEEVLEPELVDEPAAAEEFEEAAEETFEEFVEDEIPEDEFEDIEEGFETFDEIPAQEPAPEADDLDFDEFDVEDFDELEEEFDGVRSPQPLDGQMVNQLAGTVRIDRFGNIAWAGDIVLPTVHRRY